MTLKIEDTSRYMHLLVFFDLPVKTKKERFFAARFRRDLQKAGFSMVQYSVYCRVCKGQASVDLYSLFLSKIIPPRGSVRALTITDMQYARMKILLGKQKLQEKTHTQLLLF